MRLANSTICDGRRFIRTDETDFVDPLDPRAAVPSGHGQPNGLAVIVGHRLAVHADGEERTELVEIREWEHPAGADDRALRHLADVIVAADQDRGGVLRRLEPRHHFGERNAFPFGHAHQPEIRWIAVARALEQVRAHLLRQWGQIVELQQLRPARAVRSRRASTAPGDSPPPPAFRCGCRRARSG